MPEFPDNSAKTFASGDELIGFSGTTDHRFPFTTFFNNVDTDNIAEGATHLYYTAARFNSAFAAKDTGDLQVDGVNFFMNQAALFIDHTDILALNTTSLLILEVPADRWVMMTIPTGHFAANGSAYTNFGIDIIDRDTGNILFEFPSTLLNSTTAKTAIATPPTGGVLVTLGGSIYVKAKTSDPTGGTPGSALKIAFTYTSIDFTTIV